MASYIIRKPDAQSKGQYNRIVLFLNGAAVAMNGTPKHLWVSFMNEHQILFNSNNPEFILKLNEKS